MSADQCTRAAISASQARCGLAMPAAWLRWRLQHERAPDDDGGAGCCGCVCGSCLNVGGGRV